MTDVRVTSSEPVVSDFRDSKNSPIVIDESTDIAHYLVDETVTPLKALAGISYGGFYQYQIPTTITVSASSTFYQITGNTALSLLGMSFASDALTITDTGVYKIEWSASFSDGGSNRNIQCGIFINGSLNQPSASTESTTGASSYSQCSGATIASITAAQTVDLRIANDTDTNNLDILHASITILRLA